MSLWDKLPTDIIQHIFEYDPTYKEILNESLNFINHACPTCCCDGGEKNRYRHHFDIGTFQYTFWDNLSTWFHRQHPFSQSRYVYDKIHS